MNRLRLAVVPIIALILVVHLALPGVVRANYLPLPTAEELALGLAIFLVSPLLLTLIIEGPIVILPLRRAMASIKKFALMVVVINICSYLFGLGLLFGDSVLLVFLNLLIPIPVLATVFWLYVFVEMMVTSIEVIWIGAIAKPRLTQRPGATGPPSVASVRRLVVLANLVTATLGLFSPVLIGWLVGLFF